MTDDETPEMLDESPEIEVANADVGKFNIVLFATLTVICVAYLFLYFTR